MTDAGALIAAALLVPLCTGAGALCFHRHPNARDATTIIGCLALMLPLFFLLRAQPELSTQAEGALHWQVAELFPGAPVVFSIEPLGMLFALLAAVLWLVNSLYSIGYMRGNQHAHQSRFYFFFALAIFCTMGVAMSGNLLTLFIFYEGLTLATYPLVTHKGNAEARAGGRVYLAYLLGTSICLFLPAILICHTVAGTLDFRAGGILAQTIEERYVLPLFLMFMFGIGKAALVPVHRWLPAAMVAPTPVSALLHAVAVVKAGVFAMVKVTLYVFGEDLLGSLPSMDTVVYLAGFTILYSSIIALRADNLKRLLAYSTISHLSYVTMATVILAPLSIAGAVLHIVAHAFGKITLFFAAGAIYTASKKTQVSQLAGIGRRMPVTMTAFAIGSLSMIGVPLTAGFLGKWYILQGAYRAEAWFAILVIVISTILNAAYFLPIVHAAFFRGNGPSNQINEAPWPMLAALGFTAAISLLIFFFPAFLLPFPLALIT